MSALVELVYDADCPQVGSARSALLKAFLQARLPASWSEWELHDPQAPDYVRNCGSPTVLVNGRDVAPPLTSAGGGCCRLYQTTSKGLRGTPPADLIAAALGRNSGVTRGTPLLAAVPGALVAALPTCPFCWPLYAGALSALGLGFLLDEKHMLSLAGLLLLLTITPLGYRARARHGYGPLLIGVLGACTILIGKFVWASGDAPYAGLALILGASVWNVWPQKAMQCARCNDA